MCRVSFKATSPCVPVVLFTTCMSRCHAICWGCTLEILPGGFLYLNIFSMEYLQVFHCTVDFCQLNHIEEHWKGEFS